MRNFSKSSDHFGFKNPALLEYFAICIFAFVGLLLRVCVFRLSGALLRNSSSAADVRIKFISVIIKIRRTNCEKPITPRKLSFKGCPNTGGTMMGTSFVSKSDTSIRHCIQNYII